MRQQLPADFRRGGLGANERVIPSSFVILEPARALSRRRSSLCSGVVRGAGEDGRVLCCIKAYANGSFDVKVGDGCSLTGCV